MKGESQEIWKNEESQFKNWKFSKLLDLSFNVCIVEVLEGIDCAEKLIMSYILCHNQILYSYIWSTYNDRIIG